ncbi:hypothetical protein CPB83DRAFT_850741 [Crepidotus variabilis]|uniref:Uncharacterized protein n=1 Tax=Crepidotus variabilis TaxID=179855 RepID=A0A9P6JRY0_9AGAR|nr:hypothetical protein CPB83DRAFT_850741 [Crepidotus variabilis]
MTSSSFLQARILLKELKPPPHASKFRGITDLTRLQRLSTWKDSLSQNLETLVAFLEKQTLSSDNKAEVAATVLPLLPSGFQNDLELDNKAPVLATIRSLDWISHPSKDVVNRVLTDHLRPIFKSNPHPHLHAETARKLSRPAGGQMAMQDYYENQGWKHHPGISNVVLWCLQVTETDAFDQVWHLLIPPVMAFVDDYEVKAKLQGVILVQEMLLHMPKSLLRRTGIDVLLRQSLRTALSQLEGPDSPALVELAIKALVDLILLTTSPGSTDRFGQLSSLLGEGVISGIWLYCEDKPSIVNATFNALPYLILTLGIGTVRFLQAIVPQLAFALIPNPFSNQNLDIQLSALKVIESLLDTCAPRIPAWKETILDAVGRCWAGIQDDVNRTNHQDLPLLEVKLRSLCEKLAKVCPSVLQEEYPAFIAADERLFQSLLPDILSPKADEQN